MNQEEFGEYLRTLRKGKNLTLVELAEVSKVSNPYISQIENGKFKPSNEVLQKLAKPLGVSHFDLMVAAGYSDALTLIDETVLDLNKTVLEIKDTKERLADYKGRAERAEEGYPTASTAEEYWREYNEILGVLKNKRKHQIELSRRLYKLKKEAGHYTDEERQASEREEFYNSMTLEEEESYIKEQIKWQKKYSNIQQYKEKIHVRLEDFLNDRRRSFYIDDHKLSDEDIKMLITLYGGKEKNYPSDEQIEEEYEEIKKAQEENKKKIADEDAFFIVEKYFDIDTNED